MKTFILYLFLLISFVSSFSAPVWAHPNDVPDPGFVFTSDFGPRNVTPWHPAIDYGAGAGVAAPLLEDGTVTGLSRPNVGSIIILTIQGVHTFRYLHMFNDTVLPIFSGSFILAQVSGGNLAIVSRTPGFLDRANYIISPTAGQTVTINSDLLGIPGPTVPTVLRNAAGAGNAISTNQLNTVNHPAVGAAGTSGGYPAHLHVDLGFNVSENPLYHIADRNSAYVVKMLDTGNTARLGDYFVGPNDSNSMFIKLNVDSKVGGDLESVRIYVDSVDAGHLVREFTYGGTTPAHDPLNADTTGPDLSNGATNGVQPISYGLENFVYNDWNTTPPLAVRPSQLAEGKHDWIFVLRDIRGHIPFTGGIDPMFKFTIDKTPPSTSIGVKKTL